MKSYSQDGEDVWILQNLKPKVGTFCEVGAFDGVTASNTLLFEELGWFGILVEADPLAAYQCINNRMSPTLCCAVGNGTHGMFSINDDDHGLSGFNRPGKRVLTIVRRLDWILGAYGISELELLSIDTEGTELEVWDTIGSIQPRIVVMEYRTCEEPPKDKELVCAMTDCGYLEVHRTKHNIIFTK